MTFREYLDRRLADNPEFRDAFEALGPEFEFIRTIIRARLEAGLTQRELADRIGSSQSAVARLEGGGGLPNTRTLLRLANALDLTFEIAPDQTIKARQGQTVS